MLTQEQVETLVQGDEISLPFNGTRPSPVEIADAIADCGVEYEIAAKNESWIEGDQIVISLPAF